MSRSCSLLIICNRSLTVVVYFSACPCKCSRLALYHHCLIIFNLITGVLLPLKKLRLSGSSLELFSIYTLWFHILSTCWTQSSRRHLLLSFHLSIWFLEGGFYNICIHRHMGGQAELKWCYCNWGWCCTATLLLTSVMNQNLTLYFFFSLFGLQQYRR